MLRGDIQDPFSPVWGSATALANRLFRFEADLNPHPWADWPLTARFLGGAIPAALLAVGVLAGRRAMNAGKVVDAVGITLGFAVAASPFAASYHLVLMAVPIAALVARTYGSGAAGIVVAWALIGSQAMTLFRSAPEPFALLGFLRFALLAGLAFVLARPCVSRGFASGAVIVGVVVGGIGLCPVGQTESWPRVDVARGYSMMTPYFCGEHLRWMSPSADGRRLESHGSGDDCTAPSVIEESSSAVIRSRFTEGSWNLYLSPGPSRVQETQITFSSANEVDPVLTPDGCGVVFASDQGRGLGSTALYRLNLSGLKDVCARSWPGAVPR